MAFTNFTPDVPARTEEYALVSVIQDGKRNYISITVGSLPTEEKEFEKAKADKKNDMAPIIRELERLNEQGFYLLNGVSEDRVCVCCLNPHYFNSEESGN